MVDLGLSPGLVLSNGINHSLVVISDTVNLVFGVNCVKFPLHVLFTDDAAKAGRMEGPPKSLYNLR